MIKDKFLGWISFDPSNIEMNQLSVALNDITKKHNGTIFTKDVFSNEYNEVGLVITTEEIGEEKAQNYYEEEIKKSYEQMY